MAAPEAIKRFIREGKQKGHLKPKYQNMTDRELEEWLDSDLPEEIPQQEIVKKFILEGKRKGQLRPKYQNMTEEELLEDLERDYREDNRGAHYQESTEKQ